MRIVAILGSVTPPGRLHRALAEMTERAEARGVSVSVVDLATSEVGFADGRPLESRGDDAARIVGEISAADAVIVATPVYRASMTGALKNLLDVVPIEALEGKPVGIVAMGASQHHFLGVASHLRDVLSWFGALVAPVDVYLVSADFANGVPLGGAKEQLDSLLDTLSALAVADIDPLGPAPLAARSTPAPRAPTP